MNWSVAEVLQATGGRLRQGSPDLGLRRIATDSRGLGPGDLFVALRGERFDGHAFVERAAAAGAAAVLVEEAQPASTGAGAAAVIVVPDTLRALGDLARHARSARSLPVVGITGSNGKTSTKEMVAAILGQSRKILKSQGNFNNLVGVPLTLLQLEAEHQAAVIEMGISVPGEMARLVRIAAPTLGLITNIQPAHLEGLGSEAQVLAEKGLLWRHLPAGGCAVVNGDDPRLAVFARELSCRCCRYSASDPEAEVRLLGTVTTCADGSRFTLQLGAETMAVHLPVIGRHQVHNALAAAAVAWAMGIEASEIAAGLARHRPVAQRMATVPLAAGGVLVDDTYNANPRSMMAALEAVKEVAGAGPVVAVLGEMRELGADAGAWHRRIGEYLSRLGVSCLITCGEATRAIGEGAVAAGLPASSWRHGVDHEEAAALVPLAELRAPWILVKGSRGAAMERVVERIVRR